VSEEGDGGLEVRDSRCHCHCQQSGRALGGLGARRHCRRRCWKGRSWIRDGKRRKSKQRSAGSCYPQSCCCRQWHWHWASRRQRGWCEDCGCLSQMVGFARGGCNPRGLRRGCGSGRLVGFAHGAYILKCLRHGCGSGRFEGFFGLETLSDDSGDVDCLCQCQCHC
jgi:hypothetical protein